MQSVILNLTEHPYAATYSSSQAKKKTLAGRKRDVAPEAVRIILGAAQMTAAGALEPTLVIQRATAMGSRAVYPAQHKHGWVGWNSVLRRSRSQRRGCAESRPSALVI